MTKIKQKQFVVDIDCCNVENHRIIIDQKYSQLKYFHKQLKQIFRQLPLHYNLIYCGENDYVSIQSQNDWETFYDFAKDMITLHIVDTFHSMNQNEMNFMIPLNEFHSNFLSLLFPLSFLISLKDSNDTTEENKENNSLRKQFIQRSQFNSLITNSEIQFHFSSIQKILDEQLIDTIISYEEDIQYHMQFVADVTFPIKSNTSNNINHFNQIHRNTTHLKVWRVRNNGNNPWPKGCTLRQWNGNNLIPSQSSFEIPQIIRNNVIEISYQFSIAEIGSYAIQCRLFSDTNKPFGDVLWIYCNVI